MITAPIRGENEEEIDIRRYLQVIWRRRLLLVAAAVVAVLVALLYNAAAPPVYEASALISLSELSASIYASPGAAAQTLTTAPMLETVARASGITLSTRALKRRVRVESLRDAGMVRIRVLLDDPQQAQAVAATIASRFLARASEKVEARQKVLLRRLDAVTTELEELRSTLRLTREALGPSQQRAALRAQERDIVQLFTLNAMGMFEERYGVLAAEQQMLQIELLKLEFPAMVDPPIAAPEPIAPKRGVVLALAIVFGLILGGALAFVAEYFFPVVPAPQVAGSGRKEIEAEG